MQSVINNSEKCTKARHGSIPSLAIIVPVLNEIDRLPLLLKELALIEAEQIVIVDGGSSDGSVQWLEKYFLSDSPSINGIFIQSSPGRAKQMNAGAEKARQDILLFLHADTILPHNVKPEVENGVSEKYSWGRFNVEFDESCLAMGIIAFFINLRSKLSQIATGDQAMFIKRDLFEKVGGFDDIALMEDVAMSKKLYKFGNAPYASKLKVTTSARRWKQNGVLRTVVKMWWYRLAYFLGVSPDSLAQGYRNVR